MIDIALYINKVLNNPTAAKQLSVKFIQLGESLLQFPYSNPAYIPIKPLKHEYRKSLVENYILFYWVNEPEQLVTVARVIYKRRNYKLLLESE